MRKPAPWNAPRFPDAGTLLLRKYRVDALIGEGGMGTVVRAIHTELDEPVAFKILLPELVEREDIVRRFMREAKSAAKLKNAHVARVLDVGYLDGAFEGRPYILMEYLEGADLRAIIKHHGPQDPAVATDLLLQACEAIAEAHSLGIIHRDIKPSNFFITRPDAITPLLKVVDFGIATAPQGTKDVTDTNTIVGTPHYMAPEQMRNAREANPKSDVWSLGVVLYEALEGRRPFPQEAYPELILAVGMDPPQPMARAPEAMRPIVMRCLEKSLERRYQSVADLAQDLVPFASDSARALASAATCRRLLERRTSNVVRAQHERAEPISGTPPPLTPHSRLPMPSEQPSASHPAPPPVAARTRWGVIFASFAVACALGGGAWWWYTQRAPQTSTIEQPAAAAPVEPTQTEPAKLETPVADVPVDALVVETKVESPDAAPIEEHPVDFDTRVGLDSTRSEPTVVTKPEKPKPRPVTRPKPKKPLPKPPDDPFSRR